MTPQRQRLALTVLLVVLAWVVWRQVGPRFGGAAAGGPSVGPAASDGAGEAAVSRGESATVVDLRLADLEAIPRNYSPGRDPFRFAPKPRPERPPAARPRPAQAEPPPPPPRADPGETRPPPKPRPPAFELDYLGSFGPKGRRIAVFSDGDDIYNALIGDVLQEKFVIDQIGHESVDVKFVGFPDEPAKRLPAGG